MKNNFLSEKLTYNGDERTATHVHLVSYNSAGMTVSDNVEIDASALSLDPASVSWVRVHGLKDTERIRALCATFGIDFLVVQDILNVDHPSKVEEYERYNFVVAKYSCHGEMAHISLVQGENFVLSFSETETALFDGVQKAITDNVLKIRTRPTDYLLSVMINGLVADYASLASSIDDDMDDLASELIAAVDARDIGAQILSLRRRYMDLKRTVMPLKEQFSRLLRSDSRLIRKGTRPFLNDVNDHLLYVAQSIDSCRETLASLMDLYVEQRPAHERHNETADRRVYHIHSADIPRRGVGHEFPQHARTRMEVRLCRSMGCNDRDRRYRLSLFQDQEMEVMPVCVISACGLRNVGSRS